jgi:hypothetical protein
MSMTDLKAPCRRRYERMTVMWSGTLTVGRREIGCIVRNISAGGATVQVESPVVVSSVAVILESSRIGKLRAKVVWIRGDQVGLRFLEKPQHVARALALTIP